MVNPVAVEAAIRNCTTRIARGVIVCDERYRAYLAADRELDKAYARAYLSHTGPAHEKRYHAELVTADLREARDVADAAYRYAKNQADALTAELTAWQSVSRSVTAMFGAVGRGE
jgi:hypothetical protein